MDLNGIWKINQTIKQAFRLCKLLRVQKKTPQNTYTKKDIWKTLSSKCHRIPDGRKIIFMSTSTLGIVSTVMLNADQLCLKLCFKVLSRCL